MRAWPAVLVLVVIAACGDAGGSVARSAPPTATKAPLPTGPVEDWCAVLEEVDAELPLFAGAAVVSTGDPESVRQSADALAAAYDRLAAAPPGAVAGPMAAVRDGFASFRDDLEVAGYEYERVFAGIGQRPWQTAEFLDANERVAAFAGEQCGVEAVNVRVPEPDPISRQFFVDAFVDVGLSAEQAGCLADRIGPDLGAGAAQPMAFEDAMAACGITYEDFIPSE